MKNFLLVVFVIFLVKKSEGITCYECSANYYEGEVSKTTIQNCFDPTNNPPSTCTLANAFCAATFTLKDGIVSSVDRSCTTLTANDQNGELCTSTFSTGNDVDTTTCTYKCTSADNCNNAATSDLKSCSSDCNFSNDNGYCDYIVGSCVCKNGYTGTSCQTAPSAATITYRKCVQCNSETDSNCNTTTTSTDCLGGQQYCSSAQTWQIDSSNNIKKTTITRGCTSSYNVVDQCQFSDIVDPKLSVNTYSEYTCVSTCDSDGCNTNNPDGYVNGNEEIELYCVQCSGNVNTGTDPSICSTSTTRTRCGSSYTYCSSKVTYWISNKSDVKYKASNPDYRLISVERGCAKAAVTTQCTTSQVQYLSFDEVVCQETCTEDGCNVGWPARPMCYSCTTDSTDIKDGYDQCVNNPQVLTSCTYPYEAYCFVYDYGRGTHGDSLATYKRFMERGCSYYDIGSTCSTFKVRQKTLYQCNTTCTSDGCNAGGSSTGLLPTLSTLVITALLLVFQMF